MLLEKAFQLFIFLFGCVPFPVGRLIELSEPENFLFQRLHIYFFPFSVRSKVVQRQ